MSRIWLRNRLLVLLGVIILIGVVACSGGNSPEAQGASPAVEGEAERMETQGAAPPEGLATEAPGGVEEPVESGSPTATAELTSPEPVSPAETEPEQAPPAPVRKGLEATDPGTVQLASGEVQLVEFFAFW